MFFFVRIKWYFFNYNSMSKIENLIQTLIKGLSDKPTCVNNFWWNGYSKSMNSTYTENYKRIGKKVKYMKVGKRYSLLETISEHYHRYECLSYFWYFFFLWALFLTCFMWLMTIVLYIINVHHEWTLDFHLRLNTMILADNLH